MLSSLRQTAAYSWVDIIRLLEARGAFEFSLMMLSTAEQRAAAASTQTCATELLLLLLAAQLFPLSLAQVPRLSSRASTPPQHTPSVKHLSTL